MRVCDSLPLVGPVVPTAQHASGPVHVTACKSLACPGASTLVSIAHAVPLYCSISGVPSVPPPTAQHSAAFAHATPLSRLVPPSLVFGLETMLQPVPS